MPGTIIVTDFMRYLIHKGIAIFDDVGARIGIPPYARIPIEYAPPETGTVWMLYYLSFGNIPENVFAIKCKFIRSKYGGMVFEHECRPCSYAVIDTGCPFWCPLTKGFPFEITIENLTDKPQIFDGRIWQLRIPEEKMPLVEEAFDRFIIRERGEITPIDVSGIIYELREIKEELKNLTQQLLQIRRIDPWLRLRT